jgi:ribosome recycling factor
MNMLRPTVRNVPLWAVRQNNLLRPLSSVPAATTTLTMNQFHCDATVESIVTPRRLHDCHGNASLSRSFAVHQTRSFSLSMASSPLVSRSVSSNMQRRYKHSKKGSPSSEGGAAKSDRAKGKKKSKASPKSHQLVNDEGDEEEDDDDSDKEEEKDKRKKHHAVSKHNDNDDGDSGIHDVDEVTLIMDLIDNSILPDLHVVKSQFKKVVDHFQSSLYNIRGSEPTLDMFDTIAVEAYGSTTPLSSVAQVVIVSSTLAQATCYDPALAKSIAKAIAVTLELNPSIEGDDAGDGTSGTGAVVIRIPMPRVSLEVRQQTANVLAKRAEAYRQRLRRVRHQYIDVCKQGVAGRLEHVSKDDAFRIQQEIEKLMEDALRQLNSIAQAKHQTIMQV